MEEDNCNDLRDFLTQYEGNTDKDNGNLKAKILSTKSEQQSTADPSSPESAALSLSEDEFEDYTPHPPDGGWGWVICLASFFNSFLLDGMANTFGVFLQPLKTYFNSSVGTTSLSNSLLCGIYLLIGPVVGALVNKYGCRLVGVVGAVIAACAFVLSTFAPNIYVFQMIYGVIGGIGFGMMYLPAVVGVGFYFDKKRALATGIAVCGTGIGTFVMAPFSKYLLSVLDWKNTYYILAGLILQGCVFSSLMRPLTGRRRKLPQQNLNLKFSKTTAEQDQLLPDVLEETREPSITYQRNITRSFGMLHVPNKSHHPQRLHASAFISSVTRTPKDVIEDLRRPLYRQDIFYAGSLYNLSGDKKPLEANHVSQAASMDAASSTYHQRLACLDKLPKAMADILAEMLDLHVLRSKGMLILCAANLFGMMGYYVPIIFSTDRAAQLGVSDDNAALLISIMGICNTVGRVLSGTVSLIPGADPLLVNNICLTLAGLAVIFTPFCTTFYSMALMIGAYGLFASTFISLGSIIVCQLVGLEKLTNGFGLICLVRGITAIIGPPLEGMLYDHTGTYDATFYMGGICILIGAGLHFLLHLRVFQPPQPKDAQK